MYSHFVYQSLNAINGDIDIVARLVSQSNLQRGLAGLYITTDLSSTASLIEIASLSYNTKNFYFIRRPFGGMVCKKNEQLFFYLGVWVVYIPLALPQLNLRQLSRAGDSLYFLFSSQM